MKQLSIVTAMLLVGTVGITVAAPPAPVPGHRLITPIDPLDREMTSYQDYMAAHPVEAELQYRHVPNRMNGERDTDFYVFVDNAVYPVLMTRITRYLTDLGNEGFTPELIVWTSGTVEDLRAMLQTAYGNGLVGAVLVGDLPFAWSSYMPGYTTTYPIDLFLSDMNGSWTDSNGDGIYENMSSAGPEIYIGRIYTENLTWDDPIVLYQEYFDRNHAYRTGSITLPFKGLSFIDDGWGPTAHLEYIFSQVDNINSDQETNAHNFRQRLHMGYTWVHVLGHSSPWGNTFLYHNSNDHGEGTLFNLEVSAEPVESYFVVTNGCSNARWIEVDNLANWYLYGESQALFAFGSTKLMYEMGLSSAYQRIGGGTTVGEGLRYWWTSNWDWHPGMVMLGDPSLHVIDPGRQGSFDEKSVDSDFTEQKLLDNDYCNGHVDISAWDDDVWIGFDTSQACRASTYYIRSISGVFGSPVNVYYHYYWDWYAAIEATGENDAIIMWSTDRQQNNEAISWAKYSNDSMVSHGSLTSSNYYSTRPKMARWSDGRILSAWQTENAYTFNTQAVIYNGSSWGSTTLLSSDDANDFFAQVAVSDALDQGVVAWNRFDNDGVHVLYRTYNGSWNIAVELESENRLYMPFPAYDAGDTLWIFVREREGEAVKINGYRESGDGFEKVPVPCGDRCTAHYVFNNPDGELELVWREKQPIGGHLLKHSAWNGSGFSEPENVSDTINLYSSPAAVYDSNHVLHVAYSALGDEYWNVYAASKPFAPPATATPAPPTTTPQPPTATPQPPTITPTEPPPVTETPLPPTTTPRPPTATPVPPTASPTEPPPETQTPIPPTITPTKPPTMTIPDLELNGEVFHAGDRFLLTCTCLSAEDNIPVEHYILLDVWGNYWFWPTWSQELTFVSRTLHQGIGETETILDFTWPAGAGAADGIKFWAAFLLPGTANLLGDVDLVEFDYTQ